jgi:hypothetical protein
MGLSLLIAGRALAQALVLEGPMLTNWFPETQRRGRTLEDRVLGFFL